MSLNCTLIFAQRIFNKNLWPDGVPNDFFDKNGNKYKLQDLLIIPTVMKNQFLLIKLFFITVTLFIYSASVAQQQPLLVTPDGILDKVYDSRGNEYNLSDLLINVNTSTASKSALVGCATNTIFDLYYEAGSGMEDMSNPAHAARRNVVCRVFQDVSDFLTGSGAVLLPNSGTKLKIWVRNINNVFTAPNGILGLASSFYIRPNYTNSGGIIDSEIWKTIHTGLDSYLNLTVPLTSDGGSTNQANFFYHGFVTFNFNDTASPPIPNSSPINWNTILNTTTIPLSQFDLYSVALHEITHALGFNSLIREDGNSVFGTNSRYYSRYDSFLKTNNLSQFIITPGVNSCSPMYNNGFNSTLNLSVLHPNPASCISNPALQQVTNCADAIRYVGTSNVPVFTPNCFVGISSLSHFEDTHFPACNATNPPYGNDNYFLMCNAGNSGMIRRYLKPEERNVLCDIGYNVKSTYGVSGSFINGTATSFNYGGTSCAGITVAGINDGINVNGSYVFSGTVPTAAANATASITLNCNTILSNDVGATGGFVCLQDLTTLAAFPTTLSATSGTLNSGNITFTSGLPGIHLLRYVPINASGQRGNITYIYVFVNPFITGCSVVPNACLLVNNGNFESNNVNVLQSYDFFIDKVCNWIGKGYESSYYMENIPTPQNSVPWNWHGYEPDLIVGNRSYTSIICFDTGINLRSGILATRLNLPLSINTNYQLTFNVSQAEFYRFRNFQFQAFFSNVNPTDITGLVIPTAIINNGLLVSNGTTANPIISNNGNGWDTVTLNFTTTANQTNLQFLYIGMLSNPASSIGGPILPVPTRPNTPEFLPMPIRAYSNQNGSIYYIDNVALTIPNNAVLNLPQTICINQTITNLSTFVAGAPSNGVFSGSGVVVNGTNYSFNPVTAGVGATNINYTFNDNLGCPRSISRSIIVTNTPIIQPVFSFNTSICSGTTAPILPNVSDNGITGTWSPPLVSNTSTLVYTFIPTFGFCSSTKSFTITVFKVPLVTPLTQTVCLNSAPNALNTPPIVGTTYQWFSNTVNSNIGGTIIAGATSSFYAPPTNVVGTRYYYLTATSMVNCILKSLVRTVIVATGSVNAGTLSGNQTLCITGRLLPSTTFIASVPGGTWSTSNPAVASFSTTTVINNDSREIICGPGTATITYTVVGAGGCSTSITRTVTGVSAIVPNFTQFPLNTTTGLYAPYAICAGATPIALPQPTQAGLTGTWSPATISNSTSGNYIFTPTAGLCARAFSLSVIVNSPTAFVANNDFFSVSLPLSTLTGSILTNDTFNGNNFNSLPSFLSYTITPVGTPPVFWAGGISLNTNGTYTVQPNTTPGSYTLSYRLTTTCGVSNIATVTIVVGNYITSVGEAFFNFCYSTTNSYSSTTLANGSSQLTTLYGACTIGGVQASPTNAIITLINPTVFPSFISLNPNGTFNITSSLPFNLNFQYTICTLNGGACSTVINGIIKITSPLEPYADIVNYYPDGTRQGGGNYNVLSNDWRRVCNATNSNNYGSGAIALSGVTLAGTATTPNYFTITNNGNIIANSTASSSSGGSIPIGTFTLTYIVTDINNTGISAQVTVTINVANSFNRTASNTVSNIKTKTTLKTNSSTTYPPINFPDPNLKTRLLDSAACFNTTDGDYILVDANGDGDIDENEATFVGRVNINTGNISDLTGMEKFTNLYAMSAGWNNITTCNLAMPTLKVLGIGYNPHLINVNLSNLPLLEGFGINLAPINTLNISNNPLLVAAGFNNTQISTIDFGSNPNLSYFTCSNNPNLTSINIKNNSSLDYSNSFMLQDCWVNCPNLSNICADANEIPALQNFLSGCGVSTSGININSACALGTTTFDSQAISVFPNPTKSIVTITFNDFLSEKASYEVYNVLGQKVIANGVQSGVNNFDINLENYANGLYLLQIIIGDKKFNKSIIKQ